MNVIMNDHRKEESDPLPPAREKEMVNDEQKKPSHDRLEKTEKKLEMVQILKSEHEKLLKHSGELEEVRDRFLRSAADFENAKKRLSKEREAFLKFALEGLVLELLPVLDNFERAVAHIETSDKKTKPVHDGFLLIQKQLFTALFDHGLKRVESIGKPFDPHVHEAVEHVISPDQPEGLVIEEVLPGYQLNGKLIRPAKVKVSTQDELKAEHGNRHT